MPLFVIPPVIRMVNEPALMMQKPSQTAVQSSGSLAPLELVYAFNT